MCILLATNRHPEYKLILISNRDEFFERKTHTTCWNHGGFILSPYDLAISNGKQNYGTWLGINKRGKIAVILNLRVNAEQRKSSNTIAEVRSRGLLPVTFLSENDGSSFGDWDSWDKFELKDEYLRKTGPFTMFYGDILNENYSVIDSFKHSNKPFANASEMVVSNDVFYCQNEKQGKQWGKTKYGYELLDALVSNTVGLEKDELLAKCFELASNHHVSEGEDENCVSRSNIFVPPLKNIEQHRIGMVIADGNYYGTRSQIVILVDHQNHVTFEERVLYESDADIEAFSFENPKEKLHFEFKISD